MIKNESKAKINAFLFYLILFSRRANMIMVYDIDEALQKYEL